MVSHCKRHQRIYVTNQLMDNFYVLSGILIFFSMFVKQKEIYHKSRTGKHRKIIQTMMEYRHCVCV